MSAIPASPRGVPTVRAVVRVAPRAQRGLALATLGLYAGVHWADMLEPPGDGVVLGMLLVGLAAAIALTPIQRLERRLLRMGARLALGVAVLALILVTCGVPVRLLRPSAWDDLAVGISHGLGALPAIRLPYRGSDEWVRIVMLAGAGLLLATAAVLALAPRRPHLLGAAICLMVLYAVPVVERGPGSPYIDGAMFTLLLAWLLWGERLRQTEAVLAGMLVVAAVAAAALVAPRLDAAEPWLDYEHLAESLDTGKSTAFAWGHSYAPLTWPREGTEMARIKARRALYWKTVSLESFDGVDWRTAQRFDPLGDDSETAAGRPDWFQEIEVDVRGLRSRQFIGAGTTLNVFDSSRGVTNSTPGTFVVSRRPLRRGDTYRARVYAPRPSRAQLRVAGATWPSYVLRQLSMDLPAARPGGRRVQLRFSPWGSADRVFARRDDGYMFVDPRQELERSAYGRVYSLARRLRGQSSSPYDFVERVQARVRQDASYTETPPAEQGRTPLAAFLFDTRAGYCQHFSGAMALLLRMGGIPARVASGFSPGSRDQDRGDVIVRDIDAHSWVEVYFPGVGWVTYDPTPPESPARSQLDDGRAVAPEAPQFPSAAATGDRVAADPAGTAAATPGSSGPSWVLVGAAGALPAAMLGLMGVLALRRHRRLAASPLPRDLAELQFALERSGRSATPDVTLARVEELLGGSDEARAYLRALRRRRFAASADPPRPGGRRAVRRELAAGLGLRGRVRTISALPPRPREVLARLRTRRGRPYTG